MTNLTDNSFPYVLICSTFGDNRQPCLRMGRHRAVICAGIDRIDGSLSRRIRGLLNLKPMVAVNDVDAF